MTKTCLISCALALGVAGSAAAQVSIATNGFEQAWLVTRKVSAAGTNAPTDLIVSGGGMSKDTFTLSVWHGLASMKSRGTSLGQFFDEPSVASASIAPFAYGAGLFDLQVTHGSVAGPVKRTFVTHDILKVDGDAITVVCSFEGTGSRVRVPTADLSEERTVVVDPVPGTPTAFYVSVIDRTMRHSADGLVTTVDSASITRRYELQPTGSCRTLKPE